MFYLTNKSTKKQKMFDNVRRAVKFYATEEIMEVKDKYVRYMVFRLAENKDISVEKIAEILNISVNDAKRFFIDYDEEEFEEIACELLRGEK